MEKKREACENCVYNQKWFCIIMGDYVKRSGHCSEYEEQKKKIVPDENQDYVHRIGRTGRAKRQGVAVSFVADFPSKIRMDDIAKNTRNEILPVKFDDDGKLTMA